MINKKENISIDVLDNINHLKICFRLRQELRFLEEDKKTDLYVFIIGLLLAEEKNIWVDLERNLMDEQ